MYDLFVTVANAAEKIAERVAVEEPVITWNLFVTGFGMPLGLFMLGAYIKGKIEKTSKREAELEQKKKEALETWQENMEKAMFNWQEGAKERSAGICRKLDEIKLEVHSKQTIKACEKQHENIDRKLNHIEEKVFYT